MIDILMATYNGERYLEEQIDSILQQSFKDWRLVVRDDCSQDKTKEILRNYQNEYPDKIIVIEGKNSSGGAMQNFFKLLEYASSDYVMFADQDDVWLTDKVVLTLKKMQELEGIYGTEFPLLVHTDLSVVDANLETINSSIFTMQNMNHKHNKLNNLVATNIVTGCTMLFNKALLYKLRELPGTAVMHDMWIAMVASAFGRIGFVEKATILYRQHGNNCNGAKNLNSFAYVRAKLFGLKAIKKHLKLQYAQAGEFLRIYGSELEENQCRMLDAYSSFETKNSFEKTIDLFKYGMNKSDVFRIAGQIFC